jgi:hypothetical protein
MLIETPYKVGDTISLKLSSGEEIVARMDGEDSEYFTLKKPMVLIMQEKGLGLAPFMFSVDPGNKFMMRTSSVTCVSKTQTDIANQYIATTTGLTIN